MSSRLLPVFALFVAAAILFGYISPTWSGSIAEAKTAIELNDQALLAASEYKAKENALASARAAIDPENLRKLSILLPDSVDNVRLILDLNALAARSGLSLGNIDVTANNSGNTSDALGAPIVNPLGSVNLSLSAVGTFTALQAFLSGIEMSARLLDIQDLAVKGSDTGVYAYQTTLRLYWLR